MKSIIPEETIDRPIGAKGLDLLKRQDFADTIAETIKNWVSEDGSLVLSIVGEWGDGKTSLIDLIDRNFNDKSKTSSSDKPYLIKFNPWDWAAQDKIHEAFFDELSKQLKSSLKKVASKLKNLGKHYGSAKIIVGELRTILITLIGALGLSISILGDSSQIAYLKDKATTILLIVGPIILLGKQLNEPFAKIIDAIFSNESGDTLEQSKEKLRKELLKVKKPIVVVIDDIDRLTTSEIRQVFQLIKIHSDLPRIIFVLPYAQKVVEKSLEDEAFEGKEYLEKLVDISLNIPALHPSTIKDYLFHHLKVLFKEEEVDWDRLQLVYETKQLFRYFGNLRHVKRYLNNLRVHLVHMHYKKNNQKLNFNAVDLIVLEALRIFEPSLYNQLPKFKYELTGHDSFSLYRGVLNLLEDKDGKNGAKTAIDIIVKDIPQEKLHTIKELLVELFPKLKKGIADKLYSTSENELEENLRVASSEYFSRYFEFSLPQNAVGQDEFSEWISKIHSAMNFYEFYKSKFINNDRAEEAIQKLYNELYKIPNLDFGEFFIFLFKAAENRKEDIYSLARRVFEKYWRRSAEISKGIEYALDNDLSFYLPTVLMIHFEESSNKPIETTKEFLDKFRKEVLERISRAALSDEFMDNPNFVRIFHFWRKHKPDEVKQWVQNLTILPTKILDLLSKFIGYSTSSKTTTLFLHKNALTITDLQLDKVKQLFSNIDVATLDTKEKQATYDIIMNDKLANDSWRGEDD